jgi:two-component system, OmpR family, flagellar system response regulator FtcR
MSLLSIGKASSANKKMEEGKMIVVVEQNASIAETFKSTLGREGYAAVSFDPDDFISWFKASPELDLASLEGVLLGDFATREIIAKAIRSRTSVPSIALNDFNTLDSTLKLYEAGVDDVVRKPVHAKELIARINAIRRRAGSAKNALWDHDGLVIHGDGRDPEVFGETLKLPRRERRILEFLASNKGRRVSKPQIYSAVYGLLDEAVEECVVESHISKLRKKLREKLGFDPIDTQRFLGYQLLGQHSAAAA